MRKEEEERLRKEEEERIRKEEKERRKREEEERIRKEEEEERKRKEEEERLKREEEERLRKEEEERKKKEEEERLRKEEEERKRKEEEERKKKEEEERKQKEEEERKKKEEEEERLKKEEEEKLRKEEEDKKKREEEERFRREEEEERKRKEEEEKEKKEEEEKKKREEEEEERKRKDEEERLRKEEEERIKREEEERKRKEEEEERKRKEEEEEKKREEEEKKKKEEEERLKREEEENRRKEEEEENLEREEKKKSAVRKIEHFWIEQKQIKEAKAHLNCLREEKEKEKERKEEEERKKKEEEEEMRKQKEEEERINREEEERLRKEEEERKKKEEEEILKREEEEEERQMKEEEERLKMEEELKLRKEEEERKERERKIEEEKLKQEKEEEEKRREEEERKHKEEEECLIKEEEERLRKEEEERIKKEEEERKRKEEEEKERIRREEDERLKMEEEKRIKREEEERIKREEEERIKKKEEEKRLEEEEEERLRKEEEEKKRKEEEERLRKEEEEQRRREEEESKRKEEEEERRKKEEEERRRQEKEKEERKRKEAEDEQKRKDEEEEERRRIKEEEERLKREEEEKKRKEEEEKFEREEEERLRKEEEERLKREEEARLKKEEEEEKLRKEKEEKKKREEEERIRKEEEEKIKKEEEERKKKEEEERIKREEEERLREDEEEKRKASEKEKEMNEELKDDLFDEPTKCKALKKGNQTLSFSPIQSYSTSYASPSSSSPSDASASDPQNVSAASDENTSSSILATPLTKTTSSDAFSSQAASPTVAALKEVYKQLHSPSHYSPQTASSATSSSPSANATPLQSRSFAYSSHLFSPHSLSKQSQNISFASVPSEIRCSPSFLLLYSLLQLLKANLLPSAHSSPTLLFSNVFSHHSSSSEYSASSISSSRRPQIHSPFVSSLALPRSLLFILRCLSSAAKRKETRVAITNWRLHFSRLRKAHTQRLHKQQKTIKVKEQGEGTRANEPKYEDKERMRKKRKQREQSTSPPKRRTRGQVRNIGGASVPPPEVSERIRARRGQTDAFEGLETVQESGKETETEENTTREENAADDNESVCLRCLSYLLNPSGSQQSASSSCSSVSEHTPSFLSFPLPALDPSFSEFPLDLLVSLLCSCCDSLQERASILSQLASKQSPLNAIREEFAKEQQIRFPPSGAFTAQMMHASSSRNYNTEAKAGFSVGMNSWMLLEFVLHLLVIVTNLSLLGTVKKWMIGIDEDEGTPKKEKKERDDESRVFEADPDCKKESRRSKESEYKFKLCWTIPLICRLISVVLDLLLLIEGKKQLQGSTVASSSATTPTHPKDELTFAFLSLLSKILELCFRLSGNLLHSSDSHPLYLSSSFVPLSVRALKEEHEREKDRRIQLQNTSAESSISPSHSLSTPQRSAGSAAIASTHASPPNSFVLTNKEKAEKKVGTIVSEFECIVFLCLSLLSQNPDAVKLFCSFGLVRFSIGMSKRALHILNCNDRRALEDKREREKEKEKRSSEGRDSERIEEMHERTKKETDETNRDVDNALSLLNHCGLLFESFSKCQQTLSFLTEIPLFHTVSTSPSSTSSSSSYSSALRFHRGILTALFSHSASSSLHNYLLVSLSILRHQQQNATLSSAELEHCKIVVDEIKRGKVAGECKDTVGEVEKYIISALNR
eukprot:MONOS_6103.1-p1 / transcript=MONOS_6103.1 / gene=MONOS_6103 / organism=Monocercomonoides_exilis_PA203 / gene_product=neurofilament protein / transcript_product=neurofilament protein / location=Mono_scaffold00188:18342-23327(-) / protein_length=1661 / sequence_SO=supercontig / SO=protein_coding / is_pseudo=false